MRLLPGNIDPHEFYKSKYRFYHWFSYWVAIISAVAMPAYFVSDCQLFGRIAWEALPGRFTPLLIVFFFSLLNKKTQNYKVIIPASYLTILSTLWCTIWVVYFLPDKTHFSEGSIIIQFLLFAVGFAAPWHYIVAASSIFFLSIIGTAPFIHYPNLDILISLNVPCLIGTMAAHFFLQKLYIKHFRTQQKLEYISMYDQLTGANNRNITRSLIKGNTTEFIDELREPLSIAMFDIDFFKKVNDNFGHANGDTVLKDFADIVKMNMRKEDRFIRWGGEEFILLMPNTTKDQAAIFIDDIRKQVADYKNGVCPVTISAGISQYDGLNYKTAIDRADQALYKAKDSGRNRIVII